MLNSLPPTRSFPLLSLPPSLSPPHVLSPLLFRLTVSYLFFSPSPLYTDPRPLPIFYRLLLSPSRFTLSFPPPSLYPSCFTSLSSSPSQSLTFLPPFPSPYLSLPISRSSPYVLPPLPSPYLFLPFSPSPPPSHAYSRPSS